MYHTYLTRNGEAVGRVHTLNHTSDALHGGHERRELVMSEVRETWYDACGYYEDI